MRESARSLLFQTVGRIKKGCCWAVARRQVLESDAEPLGDAGPKATYGPVLLFAASSCSFGLASWPDFAFD
jgi:hypothetical protein